MRILLLADMHWGAIPPDKFYQEISEILYPVINDFKSIPDAIIIAGDLFDTKEYLNSPVVDYVYQFLLDLIEMTSINHTKIILLQGTRNHDNNQLETIANMMNKWIRDSVKYYDSEYHEIEVITYCQEYDLNVENVSVSILFIPEEYVESDSYYDEFLNGENHYDLIIGHGMIDKIFYAKESKDRITDFNHNLSAPVFELDKLLSHCNKCYFGHVHNHKIYNKNFAYIGPTTKWEFGKDKEKPGFYILDIDSEKNINNIFIENTSAKKYPTLAITIENKDVSLIINDIHEVISNTFNSDNQIAKIRLVINISKEILKDNYKLIMDSIISAIGNIPKVKLVINDYGNTPTNIIEETSSEEEFNKVSYVVDRGLEISDKIHHYIMRKTNKNIPIQKIKGYLDIPTESE